LLQKNLRDEQAAMKKLIHEINGIEEDKNKVGRYVLTMFAIVFIVAATLLAVVLLNPQDH
jgi:high-affinity nickel permease